MPAFADSTVPLASDFGYAKARLAHDPEKCAAVFRKDHAQTIR
jgi:hypothetical protein